MHAYFIILQVGYYDIMRERELPEARGMSEKLASGRTDVDKILLYTLCVDSTILSNSRDSLNNPASTDTDPDCNSENESDISDTASNMLGTSLMAGLCENNTPSLTETSWPTSEIPEGDSRIFADDKINASMSMEDAVSANMSVIKLSVGRKSVDITAYAETSISE